MPKKLVDKLLAIHPPFHWPGYKWYRLLFMSGVDAGLLIVCFWLSYVIRLESFDFRYHTDDFRANILIYVGVCVLMFFIGGMYRQVWRYAAISSALLVGKLMFVGTAVAIGINYIRPEDLRTPRSIPVIYLLLGTIAVLGFKFSWRLWATLQSKMQTGVRERCFIYGAGSAGELMARHILANPNYHLDLVGFLDDDRNKRNKVIHGIKILGPGSDLRKLAKSKNISKVIIAMPSVQGKAVKDIFSVCQESGISALIMPEMANLIDENVVKLRPVNLSDVLKRVPKNIDRDALGKMFRSEIVVITGAGGSIGSEICNQVLDYKPKIMLLVDCNEYNLYAINDQLEARAKRENVQITPILGSITNQALMDEVFASFRPKYVLHAAAYKHVPMVESNPIEGVVNNIEGTRVLANTSIKYGVNKFLLVSTDKAVRPTNVMGMTKRCCELVVQALHALENNTTTEFSAVRFGNVLGSSGSVIPKFMRQIEAGGPVTVTHPEVTRYFMLTSEAVSLVLQSIVRSEGGEIFVLNMGEPVRIYDMARSLITMMGLEPEKDIEVVFSGLRPGEKLYEELIIDGAESSTVHEDVFIANPVGIDSIKLLAKIDELLGLADRRDQEAVIKCLKEIVFDTESVAGRSEANPVELH